MSFAAGRADPGPTLNFRLARAQDAAGSEASSSGEAAAAWAALGRPQRTWAGALAGTDPREERLPDGIVAQWLAVRVGPLFPQSVLTNAVTVQQLVDALGLVLEPTDQVSPPPDQVLRPGLRVRIVFIRTVQETDTEALAFRTVVQTSSDLGIGQSKILVAGREGSALRTYRVTFRNGVETARVMLSQKVLSRPVDEVLQEGTGGSHGTQTGQASWYDCSGDYAAHLTLPKGTAVTVTDLDNGKTVTVIIDDRGPYGVQGRIIDLCSTAFAQLAPLSQGVANVTISW